MTLTPRVKESIKTALAMTIAIGIALAMDWDRPYWAGFAVAFISLSTVGQALNKGALRLLGTALALMMALSIIALFVQDRWGFMLALSAWVGFCTYRMTQSKRGYFWFLAGFATVVLGFDGGTDPVHAFDTAILRAQETGLGVLVYALVTTLLWPASARPGFEAATRALTRVQHRLYSVYREAMAGHESRPAHQASQDLVGGEPHQDPRAIAAQYDQLLAAFDASLDAAVTDSYEVGEQRRQWREFQRQSTALRETLERWHQSSDEFVDLDLDDLLPTLGAAMTEIDQRLAEIERLLDGGEAIQHPAQAIDLSYDPARVRAMSYFHIAAFGVARDGLQRLDRLTRAQLDTIVDIKGLGAVAHPQSSPQSPSQASRRPNVPPGGHATIGPAAAHQPGSGPFPDPDGLIAAFRVMLGLWLSYLLWIYLRIPDDSAIVTLAGSMGMGLAVMPRFSPINIFKPTMFAIAFAGILYVFVMPRLSSYVGLGTMLFLVSFAIAYLFSTPQQHLTRSIAFAMFLVTINLSNEQQYHFLSVANVGMMFVVFMGVMVLVSRFPLSTQPDKSFLRLLARFFRSSEYLMTTMRWGRGKTPMRLDYWRQAFHARQVATLPQQLEDWGKAVDTRVLPGTTADQVQALTDAIQALANRMRELMDTRADPQAPFLVRELLTDLRAWRLGVQGALQVFSRDPAATSVEHLREQLSAKLEHLEGRIEETLNKAEEGEISDLDGENFYRLLGAYRGLSDAVVEYAGSAQGIDWEPWRDSRF